MQREAVEVSYRGLSKALESKGKGAGARDPTPGRRLQAALLGAPGRWSQVPGWGGKEPRVLREKAH